MFNRFSEHVYYRLPEYYSDRPTIGFIKGTKHSLLFEAGSSPKHASKIKRELDETGLGMPSYIALSHWHWDHSFGLSGWDIPSIAGRDTNTILRKLSRLNWDEDSIKERIKKREEIVFCFEMMKREYGDTTKINVVPASIEFDKELHIDLGGVMVKLIHVSGPHSRDSVVLLVPEDNVLFLGDSHGKDLYSFPWHFDIKNEDKLLSEVDKIPYDLIEKEKYKEKLLSLPFTLAIPGHSEAMKRDELFSLLS